ncbi:hypothetical protein MC7420_7762 [Coleofasciculus chthonoplastes PCC 7420]|uniref:Uncharacterized protein n=1 Tax=Coleofasciculus chthonoplastes PCC 7420 TaxID=118168 RepID=B4VJC6_9CYAN|nr:hypothetical protein MC7420_7762 [Coleofasciculus chthonoplastes PCC 7420]
MGLKAPNPLKRVQRVILYNTKFEERYPGYNPVRAGGLWQV